MEKVFKKIPWLLWVEGIVLDLIVITPGIALIVFLFSHNTIVLSTKTWLLLGFMYTSLLLIILPLYYGLIIEILHLVENETHSPGQSPASVFIVSKDSE